MWDHIVLCGTPWEVTSSVTWVNKDHMGPYAAPVESKHLDVNSTERGPSIWGFLLGWIVIGGWRGWLMGFASQMFRAGIDRWRWFRVSDFWEFDTVVYGGTLTPILHSSRN